jgi:hypothetical protein
MDVYRALDRDLENQPCNAAEGSARRQMSLPSTHARHPISSKLKPPTRTRSFTEAQMRRTPVTTMNRMTAVRTRAESRSVGAINLVSTSGTNPSLGS